MRNGKFPGLPDHLREVLRGAAGEVVAWGGLEAFLRPSTPDANPPDNPAVPPRLPRGPRTERRGSTGSRAGPRLRLAVRLLAEIAVSLQMQKCCFKAGKGVPGACLRRARYYWCAYSHLLDLNVKEGDGEDDRAFKEIVKELLEVSKAPYMQFTLYDRDWDKLLQLIRFLDTNRDEADENIHEGLVAFCVKGEFHIDDWGRDAADDYDGTPDKVSSNHPPPPPPPPPPPAGPSLGVLPQRNLCLTLSLFYYYFFYFFSPTVAVSSSGPAVLPVRRGA